MAMQRRVSPRFQNLPNDGNSSIEKIYHATDSEKPPNTRVSPRLQSIPLEKRPYYGSTQKKKPLNDSQDKLKEADKRCNRVKDSDHEIAKSKMKDLDEEGKNAKTLKSSEKISHATDSKKPPNTRVSPRHQSIPFEKRPYYGSTQKKKLLNDSQDKLKVKKLKLDHSTLDCVTNLYDLYNGSVTVENFGKDVACLQETGSKQGSDGDILASIPAMTTAMAVKNKLRLFNKYFPHFTKEEDKRCNRVKDSDHEIAKSKMKDLGEEGKSAKTLESIEKISHATDSKKPPNTRVSPRLQSIPLEKRPYYGSTQQKKPLNDSQDKLKVKKLKLDQSAVDCVTNLYDLDNGSVTVENGGKDVACLQETGSKQGNDGDILASIPGMTMAMAVKNNLRLFNKYSPHFTKEDKRCNRVKDSDHGIAKSKMKDMLKENEVLCHERYFGDLSGIKVGHRFYSRAEMVALMQKGIDYIGKPHGKSEYSGYTFPLAAAIVLSGQYEDDFDNRDETIYTVEGRNGLLGNNHQVKDQVMLRGNLALKNNKEQSLPVRVIRGHKCDDSHGERLYIYDGLYKVTDYWNEKGISGFEVFKYRLKRLGGQDELRSQNQVQRGKVSRVLPESPGLVCKDISNGQEDKWIPVLNLYNPSVAPKGFKYIKSIQVAKNVRVPPNAPGCNCKGKCTPRSCSCARLNGGDFPYVSQDGGRLFEAKDVIFECGPKCGCGPQCVNRTSQRGLKYRLEVYFTKDKGWAVRSWDFIPSGAPVCEYVGVLRKNDELEDISENDYIFEIDCWHTMKGIGGRERRLGDVSLPMSNLVKEVDEKTLESEPEPEFCIDASSFGNVARFINHSCDPNLFVQCILSSHHDVRLARIVLFAADDIPPWQELTYDYNYAIDSVIGPDGKTKQMPCHCGAADCRKRLY
ncbi:hypothetical protein REPUB_Repub04eG0149500 [Reevesia pubescens]